MTEHYIRAAIMFAIIAMMCTALIFPAKRFKLKPPVVQFYWAGLWAFLAIITATAGASSFYTLLGVNTDTVAGNAMVGVSAAFVFFVVFAWFRLTIFAATGLFKKAPAPIAIEAE